MPDEVFYVCLYLDDKQLIGSATGWDSNFAETMEVMEPNAKSSEETQPKSSFEDIFDQFTSAMLSYIEMLPMIASIAPTMSSILQLDALKKYLGSNGEISSETEKRIVYKLPTTYYADWKTVLSSRRSLEYVGRQLPKMLLIGVVSAFEHHQSMTLTQYYKLNSARFLGSEKTIPLSDIIAIGSIDELKQRLLEKEVDLGSGPIDIVVPI